MQAPKELSTRVRFDRSSDRISAMDTFFNPIETTPASKADACIIQITNVRIPCNNLKKWDERLPKIVDGRSGWVGRVVAEGDVKSGDPITVLTA